MTDLDRRRSSTDAVVLGDLAPEQVRVRFPPSPTGNLHVGNVRSALFNWAFARHFGGTLVLRIEDTDLARNTPEGYASVIDALHWLGIDYDEGPEVGGEFGPYKQSERFDIYRDIVERLREAGSAYDCFCTNEEVEARRKASGSKVQGYDGYCRGLTDEQRQAFEAEGRTPRRARCGCPTARSSSTTSSAARSSSSPSTCRTSRSCAPTATRSTRWSTRSTTR